MTPLGASNPALRRLRRLLRDADARRAEGRVVLEGRRLLDGARARGAEIEAVYGEGGIPIAPGVLERISDVHTPQPVLAVAIDPVRAADAGITGGAVLVGVDINDPGNAGTMVRSAEASGCAAVVFAGNSVDPRNPKCVRASAGAIFGISVVEADDPVSLIELLTRIGHHPVAAVAHRGAVPERLDLTGDVAIVVGSEAHGLAPEAIDACRDRVTVPMASAAESLNVAMAATVLCFEAARQRRAVR